MKKSLRVLAVVLSLLLVCTALPVFAEEAGLLDGCLVILHTNDIHGSYTVGIGEDGAQTGFGFENLIALKKEYEAQGATVLLMDAGDACQGSAMANTSKGEVGIRMLNNAGYTVACPGNHEFDWGMENFESLKEIAEYPILVANIVDKATGEQIYEGNTVIEAAGYKLGVFGLISPETLTKCGAFIGSTRTILMAEDLYACAQEQVNALKEQGCDLIICLGHMGTDAESEPNRSVDVIANVEGIDLFIDAHSHSVIPAYTEGSTVLQSTGSSFGSIGVILYDGTTINGTLLNAADYTNSDAETAAFVNGIADEVNAQLNVAFATTEVFLNGERDPGVRTMETNLGDFTTDAILWEARQYLGQDAVDACLTNGGGIRASVEAGEITMADMKTIYPFGNTVAILKVTGAELLETIEAACCSAPAANGGFPQVSGITYTVDTSVAFEEDGLYPDTTFSKPKNPGSRVTIESVGGEAFDPEAEYAIATNNFTAAGGDSYYVFGQKYAINGFDTGMSLEDALVNYVQDVLGGTITAEDYGEAQGRIIVK